MTANERFQQWLSSVPADDPLHGELASIKEEPDAIAERFSSELTFGTAGLRGLLGAGTSRMNLYTVGRAAQGFAEYLAESFPSPSVAISFDSRIMSREFAEETAIIMAANGVKAHIFTELTATPILSYAVRSLRCSGGVMVTASHNPKEYNGYKCYGPDGCQLSDEPTAAVYGKIENVDIFKGVKRESFIELLASGMIKYIDEELIEDFCARVIGMSIHPSIIYKSGLSLVYTPLNGTGRRPIETVLSAMESGSLHVVESQQEPDGTFPTCPYPNPENREAFGEAMKLAAEIKPDIVIASDPDADRVACAVRQGEEYVFLTGNEVGALITHYILSERKKNGTLSDSPVLVKTIVSSPMCDRIAADYACKTVNVLTGFKYIGGVLTELEKSNEAERFIMGFEESIGYLIGPYVRDKDAVTASMYICEIAAFYKLKGLTLKDAMDRLYSKYGCYLSQTDNFYFRELDGKERMAAVMDTMRADPPASAAGYRVTEIRDYEKPQATSLPPSNVLAFRLENGSEILVRPSGTEPKLKIYFTSVEADFAASGAKLKQMSEEFESRYLKT